MTMDERYEGLFVEYAEELADAKRFVEQWWAELIRRETAQIGSTAEAMERIRRRWPLGPAAHPYVVAVLRKYWFACARISEEVTAAVDLDDDGGTVPPPVFLCEFLLDGEHEKLAVFIAPLNYWPIGRLDDGEWAEL